MMVWVGSSLDTWPASSLPRRVLLLEVQRSPRYAPGVRTYGAIDGSYRRAGPAAYYSPVDRSSASVVQRVSDVTSSLTPRIAEMSADVYGLIVREIPQLRGDERVLALLEASVEENVATVVHIIQYGIELENVHVPAAAE